MPRTTQPAAPIPPVPPLIAALAHLAAPNHDGLPGEFIAAYKAAPAVVAALIAGTEDPHWTAIADLSGLEQARAKAEQHPELATTEYPYDDERRDDMARAIAVINQTDEDLTTDLYTPIASSAFYLGMALCAHILTNGGAQ